MLNPPVPILSKSCPLALSVEIPTVIVPASLSCNDKGIVLVAAGLYLKSAASPVPVYSALLLLIFEAVRSAICTVA